MNGTLRFEYVFIYADIVRAMEDEAMVRILVITMARLEAVTGHLERTINIPGRYDFIYSVHANWHGYDIIRLHYVTWYYTYMM